ncbi:hypothetical protein M8J76_000525 [Diaphorina citri]|nr:hypothetical protein M8J76_000525 [Diaphorina citri]
METREGSSTSGGWFRLFTALEEFAAKDADRRTDGYLFLNSLNFQIGTSLVYLFIVLYAGPRFMANRKPFKLEATIRIYNVFQILSCANIIYQSVVNKWSLRQAFTTCYPIVSIFYFTYLVKLSELLETIFFILRKKYNQVSVLHLYHHVSTLFICWWGSRYYPGGLALFPILLNSSVHIIMYTYYLIANFGPKWQALVAPIKPYITIIQMAQFTLLILMSFVLVSPYYCKDGPQTLAYIFLPNLVLVYYLFYQFFKRTYLGTDHPNKYPNKTNKKMQQLQEQYQRQKQNGGKKHITDRRTVASGVKRVNKEIDKPTISQQKSSNTRNYNNFRKNITDRRTVESGVKRVNKEIDKPTISQQKSSNTRNYNKFRKNITDRRTVESGVKRVNKEIDKPTISQPKSSNTRNYNNFRKNITDRRTVESGVKRVNKEIDKPTISQPKSSNTRNYNNFRKNITDRRTVESGVKRVNKEIDKPTISQPKSSNTRNYNNFRKNITDRRTVESGVKRVNKEIDKPTISQQKRSNTRNYNNFRKNITDRRTVESGVKRVK